MPTSAINWLKAKGRTKFTPVDYLDFYDEACKEQGFYIASVGWKKGGGHFTVFHRDANNKLYRIEPQIDDERYNLYDLCLQGVGTPHVSRGVLKVDDLIFDANERNLSMFVNPRQ